MNKQSIVRVVIPALNEEEAVGNVIATIPKYCVDEIIVVDNNSKDATGLVAKKAGATVLSQPLPG